MTISKRVLIDGLVFPEGPRWHSDRLWLSDQHAHRVIAIDLEGNATTIAQFDDKPSGLGFMPDDSLLVAVMRSCKVYRVQGSDVRLHADLAGYVSEGQINDMVVDSVGRAYVGCRPGRYAHPPSEPGWIIAVEPDGTHQIAADSMMGPNGSVITPDGHTLIVAETPLSRLTAFDIGTDGLLSSRRMFADVTDRGHPDGICLDAEGAVWIGGGRACMRVHEGGQISDEIMMDPDRTAVACMLGGKDRRTLFVLATQFTTAGLQTLWTATTDHLSEARGRVEAVEVAVPGAGLP